jgi:GH15 family glucan-1,4-alpha-glucosidase
MTLATGIEDYALIGDCKTAALVSRDGSIDWACFPRFDSGACFAALLGDEGNGRWALTPSQPFEVSRRYRDDTLILETEFRTETGIAVVVDFMPLREGASTLVRTIEGREGVVAFDLDLVIRFDYGRTVPWVSREDEHTITAIAGPDMVVLTSPVPLHGEDARTRGRFPSLQESACRSCWSTASRTSPDRHQDRLSHHWRKPRRFGVTFPAAAPMSAPGQRR